MIPLRNLFDNVEAGKLYKSLIVIKNRDYLLCDKICKIRQVIDSHQVQ